MFIQRAYDALIAFVSLGFLAFAVYVLKAGWTPVRSAVLVLLLLVGVLLACLRGRLDPRFKEGLVYPFFLLGTIELLLQLTSLAGLLPNMNVNDPVAFGRVYQNQEGFAHGLRNRHGWFSGRARFSEAADRRILLIGDSFIEAPHVAKSEHLDARLEALLPSGMEALAIGRSGYGPAQYQELLRYGVEAFDPTDVVIFLFLGNDLRAVDQLQELIDKPNHTPERWIYYQLDGADQLVLDSRSVMAQERLGRKLAKQHAGFWHNLPRAVSSHVLTLAVLDRLRAERPTASAGDEFAQLGLNQRYFEAPLGSSEERAYKIAIRLMAQARDELAKQGIGLTVVTIPIFPPSFFDQQGKGAFRLGGLDLLLPERRLQALNTEHGLHFLFMGQWLQTAEWSVEEIQQLYFFDGSGHFTPFGHATYAAELARFLLDDSASPTM